MVFVGFSNGVTLTRSQRRANKHLTFASFLRWSRLRVQIVLVWAIYGIYNVFKSHVYDVYKPRLFENSTSAEMKRPIMLIVWFISRRYQFKTFLYICSLVLVCLS